MKTKKEGSSKDQKKTTQGKKDSPKKTPPKKDLPGKIVKIESEKPILQVQEVTDKMIDDFLFGSETKLSPEHKVLFKKTALAFQLNPLKREIYAVPYKEKNSGKIRMNIITGYEVYLKRAERTGKLDGWKVWTEGKRSDGSLKALIEIKRKDFSEPFKHEVYFSEYDQGRNLWITKPITMIKKVVMAQGFRLAFPDDLGGMPYTSDELPTETDPKANEPKNITPESATWGEEETKLFEKMKEGCRILGLTAEDIRNKFEITGRFQDLKKEELQAIVDSLNAKIDDLNKGGDNGKK